MNQVGTKTLLTERLILRRFEISDADDVFDNYASKDNVTKYLSWNSHASIDVSRRFMEYQQRSYNNIDKYEWAIEYKKNNQVIGSIGIVCIDYANYSVEIGYVISDLYWGKGIATEALKKVIDFIKEEIKPKKIVGYHDINNPNSGKVMIKAGMRYTGNTVRQVGEKGECVLSGYELVL